MERMNLPRRRMQLNLMDIRRFTSAQISGRTAAEPIEAAFAAKVICLTLMIVRPLRRVRVNGHAAYRVDRHGALSL
jgi:hypothetical protein